MKDFLDNFAAMIGGATLSLLLFAVCHEYGYFWVIGSHFQTFASTTDYFTNATQWLLSAALLIYIWVDWKSALGLQTYSYPLSKNWRTWMLPGFLFIPAAMVIFFAPFSFYVSLFFAFSYVWLVYGTKRVPFSNAEDPSHQRLRSVIIAVPILAVAAFVAGQMKASAALHYVDDPYRLKLKGGDERNRIMLRSFDKGLLVRSPVSERVEFIRWDQVEEVTKSSPTDRGESYSCMWLGWNCYKPQIEP